MIQCISRGKGKFHPRKGHEGPEGWLGFSYALSLTSALDGVGGQRHAQAALPPGKSCTPCIGGWVRPGASLDGCGKSRHHRNSISGPSSRVESRYTDRAIPAKISCGKHCNL
jgi:hypothetical protein